MHYIALKIDVVRSRQVADRQRLQDVIFTAVSAANKRWTDRVAAQFTVTHGDEVQGMLTVADATACLPMCEHFVDVLQPQNVRIGVGIGPLATKVQSLAIGMDGEAWHRAQKAIDEARKKRAVFVLDGPSPTLRFDSLPPSVADLNAMIDFLLSHRLQWTDNQREAVHLLHRLGSRQAVAARLKISTAAVSQRLSACMWDKYVALREASQRQLISYIRTLIAPR